MKTTLLMVAIAVSLLFFFGCTGSGKPSIMPDNGTVGAAGQQALAPSDIPPPPSDSGMPPAAPSQPAVADNASSAPLEGDAPPPAPGGELPSLPG